MTSASQSPLGASKFGWEKGDIEIVDRGKKQKSYTEAARLLAIVQRAGARHSATDRSLVQQLHDIAMELGAECSHDEAKTLTADDLRQYAPNPMASTGHSVLKAAVEALVLRHPGHPNQKTHGNRFGSGQAKESLRRLKDDKGARESYKATARKKTARIKNAFSPVNVLNRRRAGAVDFAKMLQARGQDLGQIHKEIADIEARIRSLGGKIKF